MRLNNDALVHLPTRCLGFALACLLGATDVAAAHPGSTPDTQKLAAASAAAASVVPASDIAVIKNSAEEAKGRCFAYMHDDATQYASCLDALFAGVKGKDAIAQQRRLGIAYFAWVGANSSARLSVPGAQAVAKSYLPKFQRIQRRLHIADEALCLSVAGDCKTRLAQMAQMERELAASKQAAKPKESGQK